MGVIGRGHDHRIDLLMHFVEHPAIVAKPFGGGESLEGLGSLAFIHVAERHNVVLRQVARG